MLRVASVESGGVAGGRPERRSGPGTPIRVARVTKLAAAGSAFGALLLAILWTAVATVTFDGTAEAQTRPKRPSASAALSRRHKDQQADVPLPMRAPQPETTRARSPAQLEAGLGSPDVVDTAGANPAVAAEPSAAAPATTGGGKALPGPPPPHAKSAAAAVPLPPKPDGLIAERAASVLEKHCARCHQWNALADRSTSDGGIADILALDRIAGDPSLVRPGEPDASPLYQQLISRQMPADVLREGREGAEPEPAEIRAVRAWIKGLDGAPPSAACAARQPLSSASLATSMTKWLEQAGHESAADTRFISLAHLYNACVDDAELAAHRQAVTKLLASLTWSEKPVVLDTVGDSLALLAVRLSAIGWTSQHWQELTARLPVGASLEFPREVRAETGTEIPIVGADGLAHVVMDPTLYARLLGLPPTLDELTRILGIDPDERREGRTVRRGVAVSSRVTGGPRIIERYSTARGSLWLAHDYAPAASGTVLDFPLLPWAADSAHDSNGSLPKLGGTRAIFTLPNGLPAFMLFDSTGAARGTIVQPAHAADPADGPPQRNKPAAGPSDKASAAQATGNPTEDAKQTAVEKNAANEATPSQPPVVAPEAEPQKQADAPASPADAKPAPATPSTTNILVRSGFSCAACHGLGPEPFEDTLAEHLDSPTYHGSPMARDIARKITFADAELKTLFDQDRHAVRKSLAASTIDAAVRIEGHDILTGLAHRYERDLDLKSAAAELLLPASDISMRLSQLSRSPGPLSGLATRLALGRLSRAEFELLRTALTGDIGTTGALAGLTPSTAPSTVDARSLQTQVPAPSTLQMWPDRISYSRDERITLHVRTGRTCHLTLVNIDHAGHATVLFPNEFARDNLIRAGETMRLPAADALYYFRLQQPGSETFVAICEEGEPVPAGMRPNFTHLNFTALGDWEDFLDASIKAAREPRVPLSNGDDLDRRRRRSAAAKTRPAPRLSPAQARAALTISIAP